MDFNIALSTIVYLMIFIFPGILFRKFYFRGEFTKQFHQGNLMERFLWTIFFSVLCLIINFFLFYFLRHILDLKLLSSISYDSIKDIFCVLKSNDLPEKDTFKAVYFDFSVLIGSVYLLSSIFGFLLHSIVVEFNWDVKHTVFRFRNYWYYLIKGKTKENQSKKHLYTIADVLVADGSSNNILYRGRVVDYYVDNSTNELESIILKDTIRYKKNKLSDGQTEVIEKNIPGNLFCIQKDRIVNINFSHIVRDKDYTKFKQNLSRTITIFLYLIGIFLFSLIFTEWLNSYIDTWIKKFFFIWFSISIIVNIKASFGKIIFGKNYSDFSTLNIVTGLISNVTLLLALFNIISWWWTFLVIAILLIIVFNIKKNKSTHISNT